MPKNFLRHYYDVYCLLGDPGVQAFLGTEAYVGHKDERFPAADNKVIAENAEFELSNQATRDRFARAYAATSALYYRGQRSEEHTSEFQSLMRISYAVFCLKKKTKNTVQT